mgnify:CR=1 FL=1
MNKIFLIVISFLILFVLLDFLSLNKFKKIEQFNSKDTKILKKINNPCFDNLTDYEYLAHMIPHHQVAIDISVMLQKITTNPIMQNILRELIWTQKYEIILMKEMIKKPPNNISSNKKMGRNYITTTLDKVNSNELNISNTYCDPHFFNPKEHMKHLKHMKLDDEMYLKHMIPHHQVAIDMSKILLKNTNNDFMIYLAYRIIRSQASEIIILFNLLKKNNYLFESRILK